MTHHLCMQVCNERGFAMAGLEFGTQCMCGDFIEAGAVPADASECQMRCEGDPSQACGDAWRILILDFTCKGAPQGGSPMALMSPCSAESYDQDLWNWTSWADLTNPNKGSPLCLQFWPTMCLATEADHEHSRVTVTRNPEKWYYNDTDWTLRVVQPAIPFLNR